MRVFDIFFEKCKAILNNHGFAFVVPEFSILASAYDTEKISTHGHGCSKELLTPPVVKIHE